MTSGQAPSRWNIANVLTGIRIGLVPGFVAALLVESGKSTHWRLASFGIFVIAIGTDRLDGDLARRRGLVTSFGTIADPIADKLLTGSALICLSYLAELPWWVTVVVLTRELGITLLRLIALRSVVLPAGRGGKIKTFVQSAAIALYLLPLADPWRTVAEVTMVIAVVITLVTGADYLRQAWQTRLHGQRLGSSATP